MEPQLPRDPVEQGRVDGIGAHHSTPSVPTTRRVRRDENLGSLADGFGRTLRPTNPALDGVHHEPKMLHLALRPSVEVRKESRVAENTTRRGRVPFHQPLIDLPQLPLRSHGVEGSRVEPPLNILPRQDLLAEGRDTTDVADRVNQGVLPRPRLTMDEQGPVPQDGDARLLAVHRQIPVLGEPVAIGHREAVLGGNVRVHLDREPVDVHRELGVPWGQLPTLVLPLPLELVESTLGKGRGTRERREVGIHGDPVGLGQVVPKPVVLVAANPALRQIAHASLLPLLRHLGRNETPSGT